MRARSDRLRVWMVVGALAAAFTALGFRLVDLHLLRHADLRAEALANHKKVIHRQGRRGEIRDINGRLLANSLTVHIVVADPSVTSSRAVPIARQLAPLTLQCPERPHVRH